MKVTIDTEKPVKQVKNFWNHIHFHPTDAIEDDWGQRILNRVAQDKVAKTVRMYAMLEDIVTMSGNGKLQYDFTLNDIRIDYMLSKGFNIFLSYNFIPPCLASDPNELSTVSKNKTRYKGKFIITSPPKDYSLWEEICREYTKHIVERYGLDEVKKWHLQCFNEPDVESFFMRNTHDMETRCREYCKLYDSFAHGVLSVSEKLVIGGPALACRLPFLDGFLNFVKNENIRLDFICFHTYGTTPADLQSGKIPLNVYNTVIKTNEIKEIIEKHGFSDRPLIVDEWGASSGGYQNIDEAPKVFFRETEVYSAYFARMITVYDDIDLGIDRMMICLSGQHEMVTDFSGFRNFFTLNFFAKPIYNAYKLAAKLGDKKLYCDQPNIKDEFSVFPTKREDDTISVLISHCNNELTPVSDEEVELVFKGLKNVKKANIWIIDADNSNAYTEFKKLGSPDKLTKEQILHIREKAECIPHQIKVTDSKIKFTARNNSVVLAEIIQE